MKIIVVTGGLGFIGSSLVRFLQKKNKYKIIIIDKSQKNLNLIKKQKNIKIYIENTINIHRCLDKFKNNIDTIYHFGEFSRIYPSFKFSNECLKSNLYGTFKVIEFCKNNNIKLVYSASSSSLGNEGEDQNLSPYAWSKQKNNELIYNYSKWFGLNYQIIYFFNVYGPNEISYGKMSAVIGTFIYQFKNNISLTVVNPGTQKRTFTHVNDLVRGIYLASTKYFELKKKVMLSSDCNYSINEIASFFNHRIKRIPERPGERLQSIKINSKYKLPKFKYREKLKNYIDSVLKNKK